jgi:hypothetical protein
MKTRCDPDTSEKPQAHLVHPGVLEQRKRCQKRFFYIKRECLVLWVPANDLLFDAMRT